MKTLRDVGEDRLIARLAALVPCGVGGEGPGDDCAVVEVGDGRVQLLKADALVEGIHYLRGEAGRAVGWKAAARVVSDFAAMGGRPERFLITLALDGATEVEWVEAVYRGIGDCLARYGGVVAGGETCSLPDGAAAVISIAATGVAKSGEVVMRSGGRAGDRVLVSGRLGGSLGGRHLAFEPRLVEGNWLARQFRPTAMMDVSDGLAKDLPRLAAACGCGYQVDEAKVPLNAGCSLAQGLGDGEDFELLLTVREDQVEGLLAAWAGEFPRLELTEIGRLTEAGQGMDWTGGWDHFR